ncbi:MAG: hypothetical protein ACM3UZ_13695 [Acidobacteriota bacterium]
MKKLVCLLILFVLSLSMLPVCYAQAAVPERGKVYLLVIDKLDISNIDISSTPSLYYLAERGAVGLASTRTLGRVGSEDEYITIGAGNIAREFGKGPAAYNANELVGLTQHSGAELYRSIMGISPGKDNCLVLNLPETLDGLSLESVTSAPGAMGDVLRQYGVKVCVLGNGDTSLEKSRLAPLIAMDVYGRVPLGDIGPTLNKVDPQSSLDYTTNYEALRTAVSKYQKQAGVIVIDLPDLTRLEKTWIGTANAQARQRYKILREMDRFAGFLIKKIDPKRDLLMVITPSPAYLQTENKNAFTPVLAYGKGIEPGALTSGATRRDFIIANTDIAPTILGFFGLKDTFGRIIGQPLISQKVQGEKAIDHAQAMTLAAATTNRLRTPLVKGYVVMQIIVIVLALLAIVWGKRHNALSALVLSMSVAPLVLLPLGRVVLPADWMYIAIAVTATVVITWGLARAFNYDAYKAFIMASVLSLVGLNIDLLTGTSMIQSSVLGYDPMAGARYYGIGNEYMGVLIGCAIICAVELYKWVCKRWMLLPLGVFFVVQCYILGSPGLGAQSDGLITAPLAFIVVLMLLGDIKIQLKTIVAIGSILAVLVLGTVVYDVSRPPELQSHIGRAASQIISEGPSAAFTIIDRKVGTNIKLIRYTVWTRVFLVILLALIVLVYRPRGAMARLRDAYPILFKGFAGILTASVIGLIINDSGIVVAATISIFVAVPTLILIMDKLENDDIQEEPDEYNEIVLH